MQGLKDEEIRREVYDAMQSGKPFAKYKKTILGNLLVRTLDPIRMIPEDIVLHGDPADETDTCIISVWSLAEDKYLKRQNKHHFETGALVPHTKDEEEAELVNAITDAEIEKILNQPFFALQNKLTTFTSPVPVQRFLFMAERMNRPVRTLEYIKEVLSKMEQSAEQPEEITRIEMNY